MEGFKGGSPGLSAREAVYVAAVVAILLALCATTPLIRRGGSSASGVCTSARVASPAQYPQAEPRAAIPDDSDGADPVVERTNAPFACARVREGVVRMASVKDALRLFELDGRVHACKNSTNNTICEAENLSSFIEAAPKGFRVRHVIDPSSRKVRMANVRLKGDGMCEGGCALALRHMPAYGDAVENAVSLVGAVNPWPCSGQIDILRGPTAKKGAEVRIHSAACGSVFSSKKALQPVRKECVADLKKDDLKGAPLYGEAFNRLCKDAPALFCCAVRADVVEVAVFLPKNPMASRVLGAETCPATFEGADLTKRFRAEEVGLRALVECEGSGVGCKRCRGLDEEGFRDLRLRVASTIPNWSEEGPRLPVPADKARELYWEFEEVVLWNSSASL